MKPQNKSDLRYLKRFDDLQWAKLRRLSGYIQTAKKAERIAARGQLREVKRAA